MTAPTVYPNAAALGLYRTFDNPGVWPHRGQVAAVGIGHSPTLRRWDGDPGKAIGAWAILAIRRAIQDAGVAPGEVDGIVFDSSTTTGAFWPEDEPVPQDFLAAFANTSDPFDGLIKLSPEWLAKNLPELTGLKFMMMAPICMSMCVAAAIESVGRGMGTVVLAVKGWHNIPGRYGARGLHAQDTVSGPSKYTSNGLFAGPPVYDTAMQFQRYMHKYGKTHDMMAPFVVNSKANGLKMPEGYWAQHRPTPISTEDYLASRWIAEPANLLDNDIPIHTAAAYLFTTADRARDLRQPPVYVLGHASGGHGTGDSYAGFRARSTIHTLEEVQECAATTARRLYESAGITAGDVQFENAYDGFSLFHPFWMEGFGFFGIKEGEALDFFQGDISISGPTPVSPSGGNIGSGRTRYWLWTDTIQQLQGRAGERQIKIDAQLGVCGGPVPMFSNFAALSTEPE
jgi:acetyl-CoA acetyltransferase